MTTQVIIFNMSGVAVATDSAVTFSNGRVYDNSEKLFCLPSPHKVAVVHSGVVTTQGIDQLHLVSEWALSLGETPLPTVAKYVSNFVAWLEYNGPKWMSKESAEVELMTVVDKVFSIVKDGLEDFLDPYDVAQSDFHGLVGTISKRLDDDIESLGYCIEPLGSSPDWVTQSFDDLKPRIAELIQTKFANVPETPEILGKIWRLAELALAKAPGLTPGNLVFIGYGADEIAPAYASLEMGVIHRGAFIHRMGNSSHFIPSDDRYVGIEVLGQDATISLMLQRFNYSTIVFAASVVRNHLRVVAESLPWTSETAETHRLIQTLDDDARLNTADDFNDKHGPHNINRVKMTLAGLPLPTLADVARQLIAVEILTKTITCQTPTVGGEIKVITITRSGGCVPCCSPTLAA